MRFARDEPQANDRRNASTTSDRDEPAPSPRDLLDRRKLLENAMKDLRTRYARLAIDNAHLADRYQRLGNSDS